MVMVFNSTFNTILVIFGGKCYWLRKQPRPSGVFSVSSTNKTDHRDLTEILLKVLLNTITTIPSIIPNTHASSSHPDFHFDREHRMFQGYHYFLYNFIWLKLTSHYSLQEIIFMQLGIISSI
jgi:hypothetical protein